MKFIIPTCDKYRGIIEANKYTTDKFGGKDLDVTVLGFKNLNFDIGNWKYVSLGEDTGPLNFSNDLAKFFANFDDEFFVYGNDDVVVVDNIDLDLLRDLEDVMKADSTIGRIAITTASIKNFPQCNPYQKRNGYELVEAPLQNGDYRLSLHYSIWRTSYFKKYLAPNISPWDWEMRGTSKHDGMKIMKTIGRYVIDFGHIFRVNRGATDNWHFSEYTGKMLNLEDRNFVQNCINKTLNEN
jgi:hypothetical protein